MTVSPIEPDGRIEVTPEGDVISAYAHEGVNEHRFSTNPQWLRREEMAFDVPAASGAVPAERPLPTHLQAARDILNRVNREVLPGSDREKPMYGIPARQDVGARRAASVNKNIAEHSPQPEE